MPCVWYDSLHASCTLSHPADDGLCRVIWNHDAKKHTQSKPKWTCTTNGLWKFDIGNFAGMSTRTITTFYQRLNFFNLCTVSVRYFLPTPEIFNHWWSKISTLIGRNFPPKFTFFLPSMVEYFHQRLNFFYLHWSKLSTKV